MADWSLIETTLETWVQDITGLPTAWRERPVAPTYASAGYAYLSISSIRTRGVDEIHTEYDSGEAAGEEIRSWQRGQRTFTFGIQFRISRQSVDYDAKHYTSLIHNSLRLPVATVQPLYAADISIATVLSTTDISEMVDRRDLSVAQIDLRMNAQSVTEDTPTGYIETITGAIMEDGDANEIWSGDIEIG